MAYPVTTYPVAVDQPFATPLVVAYPVGDCVMGRALYDELNCVAGNISALSYQLADVVRPPKGEGLRFLNTCWRQVIDLANALADEGAPAWYHHASTVPCMAAILVDGYAKRLQPVWSNFIHRFLDPVDDDMWYDSMVEHWKVCMIETQFFYEFARDICFVVTEHLRSAQFPSGLLAVAVPDPNYHYPSGCDWSEAAYPEDEEMWCIISDVFSGEFEGSDSDTLLGDELWYDHLEATDLELWSDEGSDPDTMVQDDQRFDDWKALDVELDEDDEELLSQMTARVKALILGGQDSWSSDGQTDELGWY